MKRHLLKFFLLCIGICTIAVLNAQENFASPRPIGILNGNYDCGVHYTNSDNTCGYANDVGGASNDVVYLFELTAPATVTMTTCAGTSYDSWLILYDAGYNQITYNDNACGLQSTITMALAAGVYYIAVEGWNTNCGAYMLDVFIPDFDAPVPDLGSLPDLNGACSVTPVIPTATDMCNGAIINGVPNRAIPFVNTELVTWTFTDLAGNISTQTQNVIINDVEAPVITTCASDITLNADPSDCTVRFINTIEYDIPISQISGMFEGGLCFGAEAYNSSGTVGFNWTSTSPVAPTTINIQFYQSINQHFAPITMSYNGFADANYPSPNSGCVVNLYSTNLNTAHHNFGGVNTVQMPISQWLGWIQNPSWTPGSYIRVTEVYQNNLLGTPGATDNCNIVSMTNDAAPSYPPGVYNINWTVTDGGGNTATCMQVLTVEDVTAPVPDVPVLADVTDECEVASLTTPTATDACGGIVTVTSDAVLPIRDQGTTIITWTYQDAEGNTSTQTQNVIIDDVTAPVPDVTNFPAANFVSTDVPKPIFDYATSIVNLPVSGQPVLQSGNIGSVCINIPILGMETSALR
jgi:hypothetical protein